MEAAASDARYARTELVWSLAPDGTVVAGIAGLAPGRALDLLVRERRPHEVGRAPE
jgi:hypothetical protein